ncbi:desmocollin 2-like protein [Myripristis murdjan]|uniref:desmocollin 2-like protein n=1 Tax=Myripristis murdjan TaxID=586833 RepID=UPI001175D2FA|nr:desmocollin-1-like [Myripristis murdjan]
MAPGRWICLCLLIPFLLQPVESCTPHSIRARVPVRLDPGDVVSQVPLGRCRAEGLVLSSGDPHFTVRMNGTIVTVNGMVVTEPTSFPVWVSEGGRSSWRMDVHLTPDPEQVHTYLPAEKFPWDLARKRSKRRWSPPPFVIVEHDLPPFPKEVETVGSDSAVNYSVYYTIRGPGVTLPPINLFSVERDTGLVKVHYAVDREQYDQIVFEAQVFDRKTGKETDRPLDITVLVDDINDNAPTFSGPLQFHVAEHSVSGTEVGVVTATDRDKAGTLHTKIRFSLLTGGQLFHINPYSGALSTRSGVLDREVQAAIPVVVEIRDMGGAKTGLFNTATATINLVDINDNVPTFREAAYKARIEENKADVLVLRIPVDDKDEERTKNWNAKFVITEGNENGNFRIDTDPKTNEGLLYVVKPLDFEKGGVVTLRVSAENEVPLVGSGASWLSVPVELTVGDVDEGPEFSPPNKVIRVKENVPIGHVLGVYTALDPETKSSKGIKYYKVSDPGSWVSVAEATGELTAASTIDLESPLVTDAKYNLTVKAIDSSLKWGVGTVTLLIEDVNDNVPVVVPGGELVLCEEEEGRMGSVTVHAEDADLPPYSAPFHFQLPDGTKKWTLRDAKNTSVVLQQAVDMARGVYDVPILISDLQNHGDVQVVRVRVCRCLGGECVSARSSVSFGVWGVLAMLLALAVLLLLCVLFVFACTTKAEKLYLDESSGGMLLKSNTEAPGEEVKSATLLMVPGGGGGGDVDGLDGSVKGAGLLEQKASTAVGGAGAGLQTMTRQNMYQSNRRDFTMTQGQSGFYTTGHYGNAKYTDSLYYKQSHLSAMHTWETNGLYLDKKLEYFGGAADERYADDVLRVYGYEGEGSAAGSVGCCSELGDQDNLDFLDSLGSKFKTLAHICMDAKEEK